MFKKSMHFRVHGAKNPCTRGSNHAPRVQGAPLISDRFIQGLKNGKINLIPIKTLCCAIMQISVICDWNFQIMIISLISNGF